MIKEIYEDRFGRKFYLKENGKYVFPSESQLKQIEMDNFFESGNFVEIEEGKKKNVSFYINEEECILKRNKTGYTNYPHTTLVSIDGKQYFVEELVQKYFPTHYDTPGEQWRTIGTNYEISNTGNIRKELKSGGKVIIDPVASRGKIDGTRRRINAKSMMKQYWSEIYDDWKHGLKIVDLVESGRWVEDLVDDNGEVEFWANVDNSNWFISSFGRTKIRFSDHEQLTSKITLKRKNELFSIYFPELSLDYFESDEDEEWKPAIFYRDANLIAPKDYYISDKGRLANFNYRDTGVKRLVKPWNCNGYQYVTIDGNKVSVHRLVATAFIPNPQNKTDVDHINTIRNDNRKENLKWVTPYENAHNPLTVEKMKSAREKKALNISWLN